MAVRENLVLALLRNPLRASALNEAQWDGVIRQARSAGLSARLRLELDTAGVLQSLPAIARKYLDAAWLVASRHNEALRWEVRCILDAVAETDTPVVFLKGTAYVAAALPVASGRIFGDVDILVPRDKLERVEAALMRHGWAPVKINAYDQRYYRRWMHEIPPLEHTRRQTVIDVHHNILPSTARMHPAAEKLLAASIPAKIDARARVLAPADMLLHCATHLFHEGETDRSLRDLIDLDGLLRHFGESPGFWNELVARADELDLTRPLFYGLRYTRRILDTPIPATTLRAVESSAPARPLLWTMDRLTQRGFRPKHVSCDDWFSPWARFLIYLRGHWLRMPLHLLVPHLMHQAFAATEPGK